MQLSKEGGTGCPIHDPFLLTGQEGKVAYIAHLYFKVGWVAPSNGTERKKGGKSRN